MVGVPKLVIFDCYGTLTYYPMHQAAYDIYDGQLPPQQLQSFIKTFNDYRFDDVFERQIEALGQKGDVAWGISTSGNSANVVNALRRSREMGLATIGLTGEETFEISGRKEVLGDFSPSKVVRVVATKPDGATLTFEATLRIDTTQEALYYRHGGILHYVVRSLPQGRKPKTISAGMNTVGDPTTGSSLT